jgi:hypothetical protein
MMPLVITPQQKRTLESALYDLNNSQTELDTLKAAGNDVSDIEAVREDLIRNLKAYLEYAHQQGKAK